MSFRYSRKRVGEFEIHTLANDSLSLSMAPELGGRLVSLKDRSAKREWLDGWAPASKRRIWHPSDSADYSTGPGAGIDECLPTVLPCQVDGKYLPDHGELWNQAPSFDQDAARAGVLSCQWNLKTLPLCFDRRISINQDEIHFNYRIENRATATTPFLWAWHPLFTWKPGDEIRFAPAVNTCLTPDGAILPWPASEVGTDLSRASFPSGSTPAAKVFLGPLAAGEAEIHAKNGARLSLTWPSTHFPYAGIWITRGFWKGLHHWAIEPTNAPVDRLSDLQAIEGRGSPCLLAPNEVRSWTLIIRLSNNF